MDSRYGTAESRYKELSEMYDELFPLDEDGVASVAFLYDLADGGRVLELGAGTGRVAIPLAERGCTVTAVDASPDMLRILESKDQLKKVRTVFGDMSDPPVAGEFDLAYAVYNSLYELADADLQLACVSSVARLLRRGGRLVIEASAAHRLHTPASPAIMFSFPGETSVALQFVQYDHVHQIAEYRHLLFSASGIKVMPTVHRYLYLSELDLMARVAGLELQARHSDWNRGEFGGASPRHISVYARR